MLRDGIWNYISFQWYWLGKWSARYFLTLSFILCCFIDVCFRLTPRYSQSVHMVNVWFLSRVKRIFLCYKFVCAWSRTFSKRGVMWRLNIVDSQRGHLTAACDLRDIIYTFLLTCQYTNKAYLFSTTHRTWTYIHIQCPCNLRLIYSYRCFSNCAVFSL